MVGNKSSYAPSVFNRIVYVVVSFEHIARACSVSSICYVESSSRSVCICDRVSVDKSARSSFYNRKNPVSCLSLSSPRRISTINILIRLYIKNKPIPVIPDIRHFCGEFRSRFRKKFRIVLILGSSSRNVYSVNLSSRPRFRLFFRIICVFCRTSRLRCAFRSRFRKKFRIVLILGSSSRNVYSVNLSSRPRFRLFFGIICAFCRTSRLRCAFRCGFHLLGCKFDYRRNFCL